jgi:3-phosphoshikimate 1-carboxyvinyltransferase
MRLIVQKMTTGLKGRIVPPANKSISHRALLLGAIAAGTTVIENLLFAEDTMHTAAALQALGVNITGLEERGPVTVEGAGHDGLRQPSHPLYLGNSGTTMRLLAGILAACNFETELTGDDSLSSRPMDRIAIPLRLMGAHVEGRGERCLPPLKIRGARLKAIEYVMPIASAQVKSAILLAGLCAEGETEVIEPAPSRDHTERMLACFGAEVFTHGPAIRVRGGCSLQGQSVHVAADISSAAPILAAASIVPGSDVVAERAGVNPLRIGILDVLRTMGAASEVSAARLQSGEPVADVRMRCHPLRGTEIGGAMIPRLIDEIPVLCVVAAVAKGETVVRDAQELRVKESDRIAAIAEGLSLMGAAVRPTPDGLTVEGRAVLRGACVDSHGDHRIAMALAVAGLVAEGETIIEQAECIRTSYPGFARDLAALGANVREEE